MLSSFTLPLSLLLGLDDVDPLPCDSVKAIRFHLIYVFDSANQLKYPVKLCSSNSVFVGLAQKDDLPLLNVACRALSHWERSC